MDTENGAMKKGESCLGYVLKDIPADQRNFGGARSRESVKYLVYHYTANDGDTAEANGRYFAGRAVQASAHYFVDDRAAVRSVPENRIAWSVGGAKYSDCAETGGGTLYGRCCNANSISIEMCDTLADGGYDFSPATLENAAALGRDIMRRYGIDAAHVVRHFDVNGKHCPGAAGWWGRDSGRWEKFKKMLEDDMTGEEIFEKLNEYLAGLPCPEWAAAELKEAAEMGTTDGARPMELIPRYQAAIMAKRAAAACGR